MSIVRLVVKTYWIRYYSDHGGSLYISTDNIECGKTCSNCRFNSITMVISCRMTILLQYSCQLQMIIMITQSMLHFTFCMPVSGHHLANPSSLLTVDDVENTLLWNKWYYFPSGSNSCGLYMMFPQLYYIIKEEIQHRSYYQNKNYILKIMQKCEANQSIVSLSSSTKKLRIFSHYSSQKELMCY